MKGDHRSIRVLALAVVCLVIADVGSSYLFKPYFGRLRPCKEFADLIRIVGGCGGYMGFPSNHATNAMAVAIVFNYFHSGWAGKLVLILAMAVGLSRVYLGVHYPTDVLGGFIWGGSVGWIGARYLHRAQ